MVGGEALDKRLRVVVRALDERLARDVVRHGLLGRVEHLVVRPARRNVEQAPRDPLDKQLVVDGELKDYVNLGVPLRQHAVQALGLQ